MLWFLTVAMPLQALPVADLEGTPPFKKKSWICHCILEVKYTVNKFGPAPPVCEILDLALFSHACWCVRVTKPKNVE